MATTAKIAEEIDWPRRRHEDAEAPVPAAQPLLALRTAARLSPQVPLAGSASGKLALAGEDPRRDQGELVGSGAG